MLKNRTWLTENTEILVPEGWIPIGNIRYVKEVMVLDKKLKPNIIEEYNTINYNGIVLEYKAPDVYVTGKNILFPKSGIWRVDNSIEIPDYTKLLYTGILYNIVTPSNNIITRTIQPDGQPCDNYILSLCLVN